MSSSQRRVAWRLGLPVILLLPLALSACQTAQQKAWDEAVRRCRDIALKERTPEYGQIWIDCMKRYCAESGDPGCKSFSQ